VWLVLALAAVAAAGEVCVEAWQLGIAGRGVLEVSFLAWDGAEMVPIPARVEAVEVAVVPMVNVADVERHSFASQVLPAKYGNRTVVCLGVPQWAKRPPLYAEREGQVFEVAGRPVVVSPREALDPPPAPMAKAKADKVEVRRIGEVKRRPEPQSTSSAAYVKTISGGFKTKAASNTTIPSYGASRSGTIELPNGTRAVWVALTNVTQPGIYQVRVLLKAADGVVVRDAKWNVTVDGRSPYYGALAIPVPSGYYNSLLTMEVEFKNLNSQPRAVDAVLVGIFDASRHMDNQWAAGMATSDPYGFPEYLVPVRGGYAAIPIHIPPGGVHGTERVRVKVGLRMCSSTAPSTVTANVYIMPFWVGAVTFTYRGRDSQGCAVYNTVDATFTSFLPNPYLLLGTTDLAIGPLPAGSRIRVYELYVAGQRRPEFNRPASQYILAGLWLDATYVLNGVLRVEAGPDRVGPNEISSVWMRLVLAPMATPGGVVPLSSGTHVFVFQHYGAEFDIPEYNYEVEGRQVTWTDRLLPWVEWVNAWLSASSYVVDKLLQGRGVEGSYKVVTFAGKVVEKVFASAKTAVGVSGSAVYINVGWEETRNTVVVSLIYPVVSATDRVELETLFFKTPGLPWFNVLTASSTMAAYTYDPYVDQYRTWYCLYQQRQYGENCDARTYR